jgi:hypothetical protein
MANFSRSDDFNQEVCMRRSREYVILGIVSVLGCNAPEPAGGGVERAAQQRIGLAEDPEDPEEPPPSFVPLHVPVELVLEGGPGYMPPDLVIDQPTVIDTTALTIGGASSAFFVQSGGYAILFADEFVVQAPIKVTGSAPLIVAASEYASIDALIDVSAVGRTAGPGAAVDNPGGGGAGKSVVVVDLRVSSGGGGAGYGSPGAPGGGNQTLTPPGAGGTTYDGGGPAGLLVGGSRGGAGGLATSVSGAGGGGGGALQISAAMAITVGPSGVLKASGGGGAGGLSAPRGGGGGGSGGEIVLEAPELTIAGVIAANGGGGGGGGGNAGGGCIPCAATDGKDGNASTVPAAAGAGGIPQGSTGGAGGIVPAPAAAPGANFNSKGGGGGAGVGRIWLRYPAAMPPVTTGAVITPPAALDPTLP